MAGYVHNNIQYDKVVKDFGITSQSQEELFKNKYDRRFIYSATLWASEDCEFIGSINGVISNIKIKSDQAVVLENFVPWNSLIIKAPVGTAYDILLGL